MLLRRLGLTSALLLVSGSALAQAPAAPPPVDPPPAAPGAEPTAPTEPSTAAEVHSPETPPAGNVAPVPGGAPAPAPAPEEDKPVLPEKIKVGKNGFFQPGVTLQGWYLVDHQNGGFDGGTGDWGSTFRLRRAELRIKGQIVPDIVAYNVMIDPAKLLTFEDRTVSVPTSDPANPTQISIPQPPNDTSILQDFYITFLSDYAEVSIGQFKNLLSWEGYNSASKLLFPERSRVSRAYGDRRDMGVRVEKKFEKFGYMAGVFNGTGQGRLDTNDQKDVVLRLEAYPIKGLTIAGVGYTGVGERSEVNTRDTVEADVRLEMNNFLIQAEYLRAWIRGVRVEDPTARVEGHGAYAAFGYTFMDRVQPVVRVGFLDQDVDTNVRAGGRDEVRHYELGLNYYLAEQEAKLQLTAGVFDFDDSKTLVEGILAAQVSF